MTTLLDLSNLDFIPADLARLAGGAGARFVEPFGEPAGADVPRPPAAEVGELEGATSLAELSAFLQLAAAIDGVPASLGPRRIDGTIEAPAEMSAAAYRSWASWEPPGVARRLLAAGGVGSVARGTNRLTWM